MPSRSCFAGGAVAVASLLVGLCSTASAQRGRVMPQGQQIKIPELQAAGTIEELGQGRILMKTDAGQTLMIQVSPQTRCQVTGTATPDFLSTGQYVCFVGEVDKRRGALTEKVSKLTIFTPTTKKQPGALPDQGFGASADLGGDAKKGEKGEAKGGFGGDSGFGDNTFGDSTSGRGRKSGPAAGGAGAKNSGSAIQSFEVRGQITAIKNEKMTLHVPNAYFKPTLRADLADDAQIKVEMNGIAGCALAQKGDKVSVRGIQVNEKAGRAVELEITLAQPLGAGQAKKKPAGKGERAGRGSQEGASPFGATEQEEEKPAKKPAAKRKAKEKEPADEGPSPFDKDSEK